MAHQGRSPVTYGFSTAAVVTKDTFVQLDSSECTDVLTAVEPAGAGAVIFGIASTTSVAGGSASVHTIEGSVVLLTVDGNAGAISVGSKLKADGSAQGVATTTDDEEVGAIALAASTTAGEKIPVMLTRYTLSGAGDD